MPKLYEYFGLIIMFYSNEHEPIHVHGKCQGWESRAELIIVDGKISTINYIVSSGKAPLATNELAYFREIVTAKADDIVKKWIDYFVLHKSFDAEQIHMRFK